MSISGGGSNATRAPQPTAPPAHMMPSDCRNRSSRERSPPPRYEEAISDDRPASSMTTPPPPPASEGAASTATDSRNEQNKKRSRVSKIKKSIGDIAFFIIEILD